MDPMDIEYCKSGDTPTQRLDRFMAREKFIRYNYPSCPKCSDRSQIQIVSALVQPAKWRCRICNFRWEYEPPHPAK